MKTRVVNIRFDECDIYIGRAGKGRDGYFGNPHPIGYCTRMTCLCVHDRASAIAAYKKDFDYAIQHDPQFFLRVTALKGKRLGCFCAPADCHGDVIADYLNNFGGDL